MSETITQIIETEWREGDYSYGGREGYQITTDKQVIELSIDSYQGCCEDWGYLVSEDSLDKFVGAELLSLELTDINLTNKVFYNGWGGPPIGVPGEPHSLDEGGVIFVNVVTSEGTLQFAAYNGHNGYYGHTVYVKSEQLTVEEYV